MYPLSLALQSTVEDRKVAAERVMNNLWKHSAELLDQCLVVSQELIRVAILWEETWHEVLEDASKLYFGEGNIEGMLAALVPLHDKVAAGPATIREAAFCQAYGPELNDAYECLKKYINFMARNGKTVPVTGAAPGTAKKQATMPQEETFIAQAWDLYYTVFKRINVVLPQLLTLDLNHISPQLVSAHDLQLAVPGTYTVHGHAVKIRSFYPMVSVIRSKQRPRKIRILGHDGLDYMFLLKGHEDLRQDERVMQLFGLVNGLLQYDRRTESSDLSIQRYAVVPLSPNVGLVGW